MQQEINAVKDNDTWEIVDIPTDKKALGYKWIFKMKYRFDGHVKCEEAHLVIFGNYHIARTKFIDTFALVAKMVTVRIFLDMTVTK